MAVLFPLGDRTVLECRAVRKSKSCDIPKSCGHQIKIVKSFGLNPPEYAAKRTDFPLAGEFWSQGGSSYCDMVTNSDASASVAGSTVGTMTDGTMHLLDPAPFGRILPAMVTPMKADGSVDFEAAQKLAKQLVADGADGLVVNGTTGESPTTHMEEKVELVQAVKEVVDVPVISGAGSNDTAHTVRMVEQTQEAGADAVLVVAPYYSRPSQEGVFRHYKAVNDSADKPIIVYDVPGRTVRKRMETGLTWYSGDDGLFLPFLSVGAVGIISVIAHVASGPMRDLAAAFDSGDIHEAQRIAVQLAPLVEAMNGNGFQAVMAKASLKVRGVLDSTTMRLPNVGPGEAEIKRAEDGMRASGLL